MSKTKVNRMSKEKDKSDDARNPWNQAILDAKKMLRQAEQRAAQFRKAISVFTEMRDAGEPWPGESSFVSVEDRRQ